MAEADGFETEYHHKDYLSNVRLVTDSSGDMTASYDYLPLGTPISLEGMDIAGGNYLLTGKEKQFVGTTFDFGARHYDYSAAMWTSQEPLYSKFYSYSPYSYCGGNTIGRVDPDGMMVWPLLPGPISQKMVYQYIAYSLENASNSKYKTIGYAMGNPQNAYRVGVFRKGATNISTISSNFEINIRNATGLSAGEGSHGNAIRHALWQAIITRDMGTEHATRIGNAHENNCSIDYSVISFED